MDGFRRRRDCETKSTPHIRGLPGGWRRPRTSGEGLARWLACLARWAHQQRADVFTLEYHRIDEAATQLYLSI